jgi:Single-strand binding protein family
MLRPRDSVRAEESTMAGSEESEGGSRELAAVDGDGGFVSINLAVLQGECSGPPEVRELESGTHIASVAIRVVGDDGRRTSVPVTVWEPRSWVEDLCEGDAVVVVGTVRRRFYRTTNGATGARVDVNATFVARAGRKLDVERALRHATDALEPLAS